MNGPIVVIGLKQLNEWIGQTYKHRHKNAKETNMHQWCWSRYESSWHSTLAIYFISIRFTSPLRLFALLPFTVHAMTNN